jgi:PilZ domain
MLQIPNQQPNNIVTVPDRLTKIIVSVPGYYELANRFDARGNRRKFACRVVGFSPEAVTLFAAVSGAIEERVLIYCYEFGRLQGRISRLLDGGFTVDLAGTAEDRTRRMEKLEKYEMIKNHDLPDRRKHKRIIPKTPHSTLVLADGRQLQCFVIDISVSGVAVSADIEPAIGTPLAVGSIVGIVVRHLANGFAIQFIELQDAESLEQKLSLPRF